VADGLRLTMQSMNASSRAGEGESIDLLAHLAQSLATRDSTDIADQASCTEQTSTMVITHSESVAIRGRQQLGPLFASIVIAISQKPYPHREDSTSDSCSCALCEWLWANFGVRIMGSVAVTRTHFSCNYLGKCQITDGGVGG
jgi:hypothetical protein